VKVLLGSDVIGMFINKKMVLKHGFKLQKLERPMLVKNVDIIGNSTGTITHKVEVNMYFKNHVERIKMNVCELGRIDDT